MCRSGGRSGPVLNGLVYRCCLWKKIRRTASDRMKAMACGGLLRVDCRALVGVAAKVSVLLLRLVFALPVLILCRHYYYYYYYCLIVVRTLSFSRAAIPAQLALPAFRKTERASLSPRSPSDSVPVADAQ